MYSVGKLLTRIRSIIITRLKTLTKVEEKFQEPGYKHIPYLLSTLFPQLRIRTQTHVCCSPAPRLKWRRGKQASTPVVAQERPSLRPLLPFSSSTAQHNSKTFSAAMPNGRMFSQHRLPWKMLARTAASKSCGLCYSVCLPRAHTLAEIARAGVRAT